MTPKINNDLIQEQNKCCQTKLTNLKAIKLVMMETSGPDRRKIHFHCWVTFQSRIFSKALCTPFHTPFRLHFQIVLNSQLHYFYFIRIFPLLRIIETILRVRPLRLITSLFGTQRDRLQNCQWSPEWQPITPRDTWHPLMETLLYHCNY